jgi:hypothetical protein
LDYNYAFYLKENHSKAGLIKTFKSFAFIKPKSLVFVDNERFASIRNITFYLIAMSRSEALEIVFTWKTHLGCSSNFYPAD